MLWSCEDAEIGLLILYAHGAQCTAPHKHEEYVSSGAVSAREMALAAARLLGVLQTLIRQFAPLLLERTER